MCYVCSGCDECGKMSRLAELASSCPVCKRPLDPTSNVCKNCGFTLPPIPPPAGKPSDRALKAC